MPKITYIEKRFQGKSLRIIQTANEIATDYAAQGYDLTLRQLYYQFVSRGHIDNNDKEYNRLGSIINDARLAGYMDWNHIVDRTRNLEELAHWNSPAEIVRAVSRQYREAKWDDQNTYVEVWIEKDALKGILEGVCPANDVAYFSCRGYTSQSEVWGAAQRLGEKINKGKKVVIIHLGDHDPSGIDMSRDIEDRLRMFIANDLDRAAYYEYPSSDYTDEERKDAYYSETMDDLTIDRIALNMDQVRAFNPPPNPAKLTDVRARKYIAEFGPQSWELDALDPVTLTGLIQRSIDSYKDADVWGDSLAAEDRQKAILRATSDRWGEVTDFLNNTDEA